MDNERDFILKAAIAAMQGICASSEKGIHDTSQCGVIAMATFKYAEAMNTERKKRGYLFDHERPKPPNGESTNKGE